MVLAREGRKVRGRPKWSSAYRRSERLMGRKPAEVNRWFSTSGTDSLIQSRLVCVVRFSNGITSTRWPLWGVADAEGVDWAGAPAQTGITSRKERAKRTEKDGLT